MEDNFNQWQAIWQTQKSKPMPLNELILQLNAVEQKANMQRLLLLLLFGVLIIASAIYLSELLAVTYYLIAYAFIISAIGVKLLPNLKGKYNHINGEANFNNQIFVKKLKEKMAFKTAHLLLFLFLAILGLNFALLGLYEKGTLFNFEFNSDNRIFIHLSTLVILFFGYLVNIKRLKQNHKELATLIDQLENRN